MKSLMIAFVMLVTIPTVYAEESADPGYYDFYAAEQRAASVPKPACPVNVPCVIRPIKSTECNSVTGCSKCVKGPVPGELPEYDGHCE